jgi:hypothetical protein
MTNKGPDGLFEIPAGAGGEPFEENDLPKRTDFQSRAPRAGADFKAMAIARVKEAGATIERTDFEIEGFPVDALVSGSNGRRFLVLARGTPEEQKRGALRRTDTVEKTGYMAMQLARRQELPILVITSDLPGRSTKAGHYLAALSDDVWDVIAYRADLRGFQRLRDHLHGSVDASRPAAPWRLPETSEGATLFDGSGDVTPEAAPRPAVNDNEPRSPD